MRLIDFFTPDAVHLTLSGRTKDDILAELVRLLDVDTRSSETLLRMLSRRESLGSTGIGRGVAVPHARSLVVNRLRLAFGRSPEGIEYQAIDSRPVHHFFLIVAPPVEISNQYLPVLGRIAQFANQPDVPECLAALGSAEEFFRLLESKGV
jgi:nitrogen PTS system EIIA component